MATSCYRGRFAPSPSGPLHLGSLVAALGSYLDAKAHHGEWLVRIDDVDTTRMVAGADTIILQQLEAHGLHWDGDVLYQTTRTERYLEVLQQLIDAGDTFHCICSRKQTQAQGGHDRVHCRGFHGSTGESKQSAIRYRNNAPIRRFHDRLHGEVLVPVSFSDEDFILKRRDGLIAYQLAAVVDDNDQGITDIVRGSDLLEPSAWQLTLRQRLGLPLPKLCHLPLVIEADGRKLSKQNHAPALSLDNAPKQLYAACNWLGLPIPAAALSVNDILSEAIKLWSLRFDTSQNGLVRLQ